MHKAPLLTLMLAAGLPHAFAAAQEPAAITIAPPPALPKAADPAAPDTAGSPSVEVVFVLDTTGSMGGLIDGAQKKIWSIANAIATCKPAPKLKVGLVAYRDRGDAYITQVTPLTDDLDAIYTRLMGLKAQGGGDGPESVNQALNDAVTKIEWTPTTSPSAASTLRIIYLVGDAPPHTDYPDDVKHADSCALAMKKGLVINTIQCGSDKTTAPIWQTIARASEGAYFQIAEAGGVLTVSTPHDEPLVRLNAEVEKTMLDYGDATIKQAMEHKRLAQAEISRGIAAPSAPAATTAGGADRAVYNNLSAAGGANLYGSQELINDISSGKTKLADIPEKDLPQSIKAMTLADREKFIKEQTELRKSLTDQIKALAEKRGAFIKAELAKQSGKPNSFDDSVLAAFHTQAAAKGVRFDQKYPPVKKAAP